MNPTNLANEVKEGLRKQVERLGKTRDAYTFALEGEQYSTQMLALQETVEILKKEGFLVELTTWREWNQTFIANFSFAGRFPEGLFDKGWVTLSKEDFNMLLSYVSAGFQMGVHASQEDVMKVEELLKLL